MTGRKIAAGEIPDEVMAEILSILQRISFGEVILVAQDGILVQIECNEKIRLENFGSRQDMRVWDARKCQCIANHVRQEFTRLTYGRLVIVVKRGSVIQMERTEKQRFTGLDGEGF